MSYQSRLVLKLQSSYLLVTHGSRDPRPQIELEKLAQLLGDRLTATSSLHDRPEQLPLVGTGTLELAATALNEQIRQFAAYSRARGFGQVQVLPLFLLPGVHVKEDIPAEVAIAREALGSDVAVSLRPHLGSRSGLSQLLGMQMESIKVDAWILLSHGSRRPGGNQPVEEMAGKLGAVAAYWSVAPSLETRVEQLVGRGYRKIGILPYFLFSGGITDAIANNISHLAEQFSFVDFHLAEPLGASAELADLILDLFELPNGISRDRTETYSYKF